jgi:hypothetical protein
MLLGLVCGCGGSSGLQEVSGTVKFKGAPLDQGTIRFQSAEAAGGSVIQNGKYVIPGKQGLKPGSYTVSISSGDTGKAVDTTAPPGESGAPAKERIPDEWNVNSKKTVEVKAAGPNKFDFDIP